MTMKNKKIIQVGVGVVAGVTMLIGSSVLVFAQTSSSTASAKKIAKTKLNQSSLVVNANKEIDKRLTDLSNINTRISAMKNVSDAEKSALASSIQAEVTNLANLKTEISSSTDMTTLRADAAGITKDNRIYALVIPKMRILAAGDRATTVINMLQAIGTKLQTRITDAGTAGKDVTTLNTALTDFNAKLADATSLSGSIASGISNLMPDQGNKSIISSNDIALKAARKNLSMIQADLVAARKDVNTIVKGIKGVGPAATAITPPPATTGTTTQ